MQAIGPQRRQSDGILSLIIVRYRPRDGDAGQAPRWRKSAVHGGYGLVRMLYEPRRGRPKHGHCQRPAGWYWKISIGCGFASPVSVIRTGTVTERPTEFSLSNTRISLGR